MESYRITVTNQENKNQTFLFIDHNYYGQLQYPNEYDYPQDIKEWKSGWKDKYKELKKVKVEKTAISIAVLKELDDFQKKCEEYRRKMAMHHFGKLMPWDKHNLASDAFLQTVYLKAIMTLINSLPTIKRNQDKDPWLLNTK